MTEKSKDSRNPEAPAPAPEAAEPATNGPKGADGGPVGNAEAAKGGAKAAPPAPVLGQPRGPESAEPGPEPGPAAVQAHLIGEPGTLPPTWCTVCQAEVVPVGKGRCPRCQTFLRLNFARRKHPVNVLRRQQLLDQFVLDYRPDTQRLRSMCEQYAGVVEQLESLKPGSQEHARLVNLSQQLGEALEKSRCAETRETLDLSNATDDQLRERVLQIAEQLGVAAAFTRRFEESRDAELARRATRLSPTPQPVVEDREAWLASHPAPAWSRAEEAPRAEPQHQQQQPRQEDGPRCPHCRENIGHLESGTPRFEHLLACARERGDPEEERRRRQADAEMYESLRRARRGQWPPEW